MRTIGSIVRKRRAELGLTLQALAALVGCTKGYLSQIENERRPAGSPPSAELLAKLEWALRLERGGLVSMGNWEATPAAVKKRVRDLEAEAAMGRRVVELLRSRGLDAAHRSGELRRIVEESEVFAEGGAEGSLVGAGSGSSAVGGGRGSRDIGVPRLLPMQVPVVNQVAAGYPREFTDLGYPARVGDEYVSVPNLDDADAFAARVVGDSMEPNYVEGDIVVFSPSVMAKNGSDCFVRLERDAESTFKRVFFEGEGNSRGEPSRHEGIDGEAGRDRPRLGVGLGVGLGVEVGLDVGGVSPTLIRLQPLNPKYAARVVDREEVAGMYAAVYVVRAVGGR